MEEIRNLLNSISKDSLNDDDKSLIQGMESLIGCDRYDNMYENKYTEESQRMAIELVEKNALRRELLKMRKEVLLNVVKQKYHKYYSNIIDLASPDELMTVLPELAELKRKEEETVDAKSGPIMFITVSPEKSVGVYELIKYLQRLLKMKFVKKYLYVLEQRYNGEINEMYKKEGDGLHSHLLIEKGDYKTSHVKRDVGRVFKDMVCNLDYKFIKEADLQKVQNYMVGEKADESKQLKQHYDKVWRKAMGLKNFYGDLFMEMDKMSA